MKLRYDFSGWATRNDLVCADGRTIRQDAFKDCDGKMVPLVWNHQHNNPTDILGHALLENRQDGVYAYCTFNESEAGRAGKLLHQEKGSVEYPFATLYLPSVKAAYPGKTKEELLNILNPVFHKFNSIRKKKLELYPGVKETLEKIAGMGIKVVGYTDSAEENGFYRLKRLGIDDYFQSVYVSDSQFALPDYLPASEKTQIVHGKKPNPAVIHKICQQESVAIGEIVYLGDSLTKDVYMARRAGALSVLCKYSYNAKGQDELYSKLVAISHWTATDFEQEKAIKEICKAENIHPDYTIHAFDEILAIIQTLNTIPS